ncbi:MAG: hypothetical protein DCF25_18270 [Leptolyngbya foveolarum]|uniref:Uncharacterized protein n=1 Tax=Leptolyngbya foveolarum TaxID=47253 RepID=A0A2W4TZ91_9CYAN|nr:MAG: hypothetical protein DCF25_18270 [Leptolyngbya foveolarum]
MVLTSLLTLSACSVAETTEEALPVQEINETNDAKQTDGIDSEELLKAKHEVRWIHSLVENGAMMVSQDNMARVPFVERFKAAFPTAEVTCDENTLEGKAAEVYENTFGDLYYSEICKFYVDDSYLENIEFMYEEKGGGFLGMSNSELMFE